MVRDFIGMVSYFYATMEVTVLEEEEEDIQWLKSTQMQVMKYN